MASGTQQHQYQQRQQQHQQQEVQQQQENQLQFVSNQVLDACFDPHGQMHQPNTTSPLSSTPMSVDQTHVHMVTMSSHETQANQMITSVVNTVPMNQDMCNQSNTQQHLMQSQQQQKSQLLPLLLSPVPTSHKTLDHSENPESDHDQIIDQVISLENDYNDPSVAMSNVDNLGMTMTHQSQPLPGDRINPSSPSCVTGSNQLSNSSEDLLNLLLEMDGDSANLTCGNQQLDQDEKVGIENIRKQLMSCEVQSDQMMQQNANSMSPVLNQYSGGHLSHQVGTSHQPHQIGSHNVQQQQQQQQVNQHQLISQSPVISPHQQPAPHQMSPQGVSQRQQQLSHHHHRLSVDQTLLHGPYSNAHIGAVPVSSSGQHYTPQHHQTISRISQSTPISMDNNSPSPSWQQPQLSPFSPPSQHNDLSRPSSQHRQHPAMQHHPVTTSPQMQQLHHSLQRRSPSQPLSPPATTEPSPVVKKNPLLNAQLINSRPPSLTSPRFTSSQKNVLNQNPILNSKLSQGSYVTSTSGSVVSPVNPSLNPQTRFVQHQHPHQQQQTDYNFDITQQPQNAQQHPAPPTGYISMYRQGDHTQQPPNQMFRTSTVTTTASSCFPQGGLPQMTMGSTSPSGGLSQQVKQEIRKKVQQPKQQQQHQTTSLLKQLLSDDNK